MAGSGREERRRRIIAGGQDRLALITGRISNPNPNPNPSGDTNDSGSPPQLIHHHDNSQDLKSHFPFDQPSVFDNDEDKPSRLTSSADAQAAKSNGNDALGGSRSTEEPSVRKSEAGIEPSRTPSTEDRSKRQSSSTAQKAVLTATDAVLRLAQHIPIGNLTSHQVNTAVVETEHDRMLCALIMAILVVLSYAGFPVVGSRVFRWIILFRPLFLVLITNITFIVWRVLPENQRNSVRGERDNNKSLLSDGYAWAEEAGRALELGLMLQKVVGALFMDCSVYATIVVFGLSLFG